MKAIAAVLMLSVMGFAKDHPQPVYDKTGVFSMVYTRPDSTLRYTSPTGEDYQVNCNTNGGDTECYSGSASYRHITMQDGAEILPVLMTRETILKTMNLNTDEKHSVGPLEEIAERLPLHGNEQIRFRMSPDPEGSTLHDVILCVPWDIPIFAKRGRFAIDINRLKEVKHVEACYHAAYEPPVSSAPK